MLRMLRRKRCGLDLGLEKFAQSGADAAQRVEGRARTVTRFQRRRAEVEAHADLHGGEIDVAGAEVEVLAVDRGREGDREVVRLPLAADAEVEAVNVRAGGFDLRP